MNRNAGVVVLTVAGVLLASGTAAALNTRILGAGSSAAVGTAESFLPADEPPAPSIAPPVATPTAPEPSDEPSPSASTPRASTPRPDPTPTRTRSSDRPRPSSSPLPSPTAAHESTDHSGVPEPVETAPDPAETGDAPQPSPTDQRDD